MATDLIILHTTIAAEFLSTLKTALSGPASIPTLVSAHSKERAQNLVKNALSNGGKLFSGAEPENGPKGASFVPAILQDVGENAEFWKEESFAPIAGYVIVESEEEAIAIANKTEYGLSAAVFTEDLRRGFAVAKKIHSG
jgi:acyl-CoA reductase-like NAD-dependent aldehyde dehydrogenase